LSDASPQSSSIPSDQRPGRFITRKRWPWVRWQYSLLLPVAILLLVATLLFPEDEADLIEVRVASSTSGEVIPGALVTIGPYRYLADLDGRVIVERPEEGTAISARFDGFSEAKLTSVTDPNLPQVIQLRPSIVNGLLLDAETGTPIKGADISLRDGAGAVVAESRTDERGAYIFKNIPDDAVLHVNAAAYGQHEESVGSRQRVDLLLTQSVVSGTVFDNAGLPLQGAVVQSGELHTLTDSDGLFTLEGATPGAEITVTALGYKSFTGTVDGEPLDDIQLEPQVTSEVHAGWSFLASRIQLAPDDASLGRSFQCECGGVVTG
jgi:hypothetical protein